MTHPQDTTPANPAQVTEDLARRLLKEAEFWSSQPSGDELEALLREAAASTGACPNGHEPSLLDRERAALDVTQRRAIEAERIANAVTAQVTDAMVKVASTEFLSHKGERPWRGTRRGAELWEDYAPAMRAALTAAIAPSGQAVAVKALEWERLSNGNLRALGAFGYRYIVHARSGSFLLHHASSLTDDQFETEEAAQAAAQADFERRILSSIEAAPGLREPDYFDSLVERAHTAAAKASAKFPQPNYVTLKIAEEAGEVVRGAIHYAENRMEWSEVEGEIVQLLAMLIRFVAEGDQVNGVVPPLALASSPASSDEG